MYCVYCLYIVWKQAGSCLGMIPCVCVCVCLSLSLSLSLILPFTHTISPWQIHRTPSTLLIELNDLPLRGSADFGNKLERAKLLPGDTLKLLISNYGGVSFQRVELMLHSPTLGSNDIAQLRRMYKGDTNTKDVQLLEAISERHHFAVLSSSANPSSPLSVTSPRNTKLESGNSSPSRSNLRSTSPKKQSWKSN